jgi:uncharacterized membrane protein
MAGIGFELKKFLNKDSLFSAITAYAYAGLVSAGPWILSILTIFILIIIGRSVTLPIKVIQSFQIIVVYLIAGTLILSSFFQHSYTRYVANIDYMKRLDLLIPTLNSVYLIMLVASGVVGFFLVEYFLSEQISLIKIIIVSCFVILSLIWVTTSVLAGMLAYKSIFVGFLIAFLVSVTAGYFLRQYGVAGLLGSFFAGQFLLLMFLIYIIYRFFPSDDILNYDFFNLRHTKIPLFFTGFFYNLAIWIDKFIFWYTPITGYQVIQRLHASTVYDTPIFLAYISVIPAMAIFLLNMETKYADAHEEFYKRVCGKNTFGEIQEAYSALLISGRETILSVLKSQAYLMLVGVTAGIFVFRWFNLPTAYLPIFMICLVAAGLNIVFWATIDIIFYLDKINHALFLTALFAITNALFTWISIQLGVFYFGYGLLLSLVLTVSISFLLLNRELARLQFETYMLH